MKIVDGNEACASIAYLLSEVCPVYPITPASPMSSKIDAMANDNVLNIFDNKVKLVSMQSEAGAAASVHGALMSGNLSSTFTSSQGLLLMIPEMYKMAGEMLPGVIHVASRALATHALSIFGDHQDVYAVRNTGFCILASANVEDAQNLALISHLSAIKGSLPFLHFFDGFRTSHEINKIREINLKDIEKLIPYGEIDNFRSRMLISKSKNQRGMAQNEDVYFQMTEARNSAYLEIPNIVKDYMKNLNLILGTNYAPFVYYGSPYAKNIIVAMGSVTDTIKLVVDDLISKGEKIGVVTVHLYRPFSSELLKGVIPASVSRIAVLDRGKDATMSGEPLYLDVVNALKEKNVAIVGGRYGLASKNTTPDQIKSVYTMLDSELKNNFTIGINDNITHLSLEEEKDYILNLNASEIEIYGFGSDGMVSASKNIIKILGNEENYFVQGYFEYDSKKSNGLTISHLRYANKKINAPYYPTHPKLVVITKDEYLNRFEMLSGIEEYGTVVINTIKTKEELSLILPQNFINIALKKNLKLFIINASKIANENNIKGKISKIMETVILKILNIPDYEMLVERSIRDEFLTKGEEVINANLKAITKAVSALEFVEIPSSGIKLDEKHNLVTIINNRKGSTLKVSDVYDLKDGSFPFGTSKFEKRKISNEIPVWHSENCIQCNQCSIVCPHAVIRPFIIPNDHKYSPKAIPLVGNSDYKFMVTVSPDDCTGCGLCMKVCPGKGGNKALQPSKYSDEWQAIANDLFNNYQNPALFDRFNVKGSQFNKPLFEFSGACAGCGETPYLKLLTQLFGEKLIIANATGCSSIYGGSVPSTPYLLPWVNSLFEDNAEFGFGILLGYQAKKDNIRKIIEECITAVDSETAKLFQDWLDNSDNFEITKKVHDELKDKAIPNELRMLLEYVPSKTIWMVGGDGWAYDIGYSGIDHVLSMNEKVRILVLDTEVYSNTGGQASKASQLGQVCEFANLGKRTVKKDLFSKVITIPNVYAANVCLGANPAQTIKAFKEAEEHDGPSIIIAYSPCVEQGIKGGLTNALSEEKLAVSSGYLTLMRYDGNLNIDSGEPDYTKYEEFLSNEVRYNALKIKNPSLYDELTKEQIAYAKERYQNYLKMIQK